MPHLKTPYPQIRADKKWLTFLVSPLNLNHQCFLFYYNFSCINIVAIRKHFYYINTRYKILRKSNRFIF